MSIQTVAPDLHLIPGPVNVYVLQSNDGLVVIDSGFPGSAPKILKAIVSLGKTPADVRHIVITHAHPDHIGSAAALKQATGATVWAHPIDVPIIEAGTGFRGGYASPGLRNKVLTMVLKRIILKVQPTHVDRQLEEGESLPFLPDMSVIHAPGHCAGQVALLWRRHGGVLFTADTCVNMPKMRLAVATEDQDLALASLAKLARYDFEMICFMHGKPIMSGGDKAFRDVWLKETDRSVAA